MNDQNLIDNYLLELEKALFQLKAEERANIILENHEKIKKTLLSFPDKTAQELLLDLGTPGELANHYLLQYGFKTKKQNKHKLLKFFLYSSGAFVLLFFILIIFLVQKFTPLYKFDEDNKRIIVLGGLIDLNQKSGQLKILNEYHFVENNFTNSFEGSFDLNVDDYDEVIINFKSGIYNFKNSNSLKLSWDCKLEDPPSDDFMTYGNDSVTLDFTKTGGASCQIEIPTSFKTTVSGGNGLVTLQEPEFDFFLSLDNGEVEITPGPEMSYNYDLATANGFVSDFISQKSDSSFEIKVNLQNGGIIKK